MEEGTDRPPARIGGPEGRGGRAPDLEVTGIWKHYGTTATPVLSDISFTVPSGAFVSVIGPSGCGKSTLLRIVAGLLTSTRGEVRLGDELVAGPHPRMVYVFQQYTKSIFPWKTVMANATFGLQYRSSLPREERVAEARAMLARVGLADVEDYYPYQLSGGMQQRLALARALVCKPAIILMDEPCSNVDAITKFDLQDLIQEVWQEFGLSVVYVTHDIDEAVYLSQQILVMSRTRGQILDRVDVDLPYPRDQVSTRSDARYLELREHVYGLLDRYREASP